jgi:protein transport protein SEC24
MADHAAYHSLGQGEQLDPNDPYRTSQPAPQQFQPPIAPHPYQQGGYNAPAPQGQQYYGAPAVGSPGVPSQAGFGPPGQGHDQQSMQSGDGLAGQMGAMSLGPEQTGTTRRKKKDRHAFHTVEAPIGSSMAFNGMPPAATPGAAFGGPQPGHMGFASQLSPQTSQFPMAANPPFSPANPASPADFAARATQSDSFQPPTVVPAQQKVSPDDIPAVPLSRDSVQTHFLNNVYPTFERHVPPPAAISFIAHDQGNSSPKFTRLTTNNIPSSNDALSSTGLPLGLMLQPLAPLQHGELPIPVLDFGDAGPPRCRRCRAYINPFMMFRSGGNKFVCNLCTYPNDTPPEYFSATSPQGVRNDRDDRPELCRGTVEFVVPKEYWTKEPVGLRWLFLIDVTQEAFNKGFLEAFCEGILNALYGGDVDTKDESEQPTGRLPPNVKVGFVTFDKEVHFYNVNVRHYAGKMDLTPQLTIYKSALEQAQMVVMPDIEDPFVPLSEGLFVDPYDSKSVNIYALKVNTH